MKKIIEDLKWEPMWTSHMGCLMGCLNYLHQREIKKHYNWLEADIRSGWLFGSTGHAFILNIHEEVCPAGPTAWKSDIIAKLGRNAGIENEIFTVMKTDRHFKSLRKEVWEKTRSWLDNEMPVFAWEMDLPEYYVIYGYDDTGYYYSGPQCDSGKGPKPWNELGESGLGVLEFHFISLGEAAFNQFAVKKALEFAVEHAYSKHNSALPKYLTGLAGYENWINALKNNRVHISGMAYNSLVWSECRRKAVEFLEQAKYCFDSEYDRMFNMILDHYRVVADNLEQLTRLFPYPYGKNDILEDKDRQKAITFLEQAKKAEEAGVDIMKILSASIICYAKSVEIIYFK